ncbi:hypothetical protein [Streptomyces sp. NPDC096324]|uniref:hypothetical protein n=1 Tax=Streptomyces sp. NPDC096324 TaxID=3366085 RepID=UPI00380D4BC7
MPALTLASCSNPGSEPKATVTATKTPELSATQKRAVCVDAWSKAIDRRNADTDALLNSDPSDEMQACLDNPTCTAFPLP